MKKRRWSNVKYEGSDVQRKTSKETGRLICQFILY